jgi:hypothetical protein
MSASSSLSGRCPSRFGLESATFAQWARQITARVGGFDSALLFPGIAMTDRDLLPKPIDFAALRAEVDRRLGQQRAGP